MDDYCHEWPASRERTPFWFYNTGGHPLDIVVHRKCLHSKVGWTILMEAFALVASKAPHWRTLDMEFGPISFGALKQLCSQFTLTVERLETLQISAPRLSDRWKLPESLSFDSSFIQDAPRLRTFILVSCHPVIDRNALPLWMAQVTHLELNKLGVSWSYILRSFPLLQKLVLDVSIPKATPHLPAKSVINLPDLRDFTVLYGNCCVTFYIGIFAHLSVPSLSVLSLKDISGSPIFSSSTSHMLDAITRRSLRALSLDTAYINESSLTRLLATVSLLEELTLTRCPAMLHFFYYINPPSLPLLNTLTIRECDYISPGTLRGLTPLQLNV